MSHGKKAEDLVLPGVLVVVLILGLLRLGFGAFEGWYAGGDEHALTWVLLHDHGAGLTDVARAGVWPANLFGTRIAAQLSDGAWWGPRAVLLAGAALVPLAAAGLARGGLLGRLLAAVGALVPVTAVLGDQGSLALAGQLACWSLALAVARAAWQRRAPMAGLGAAVLVGAGLSFGFPMVDPAALLLAQVLVVVVVAEAVGLAWARGGARRVAAGLVALLVVVLGLVKQPERDVQGQLERQARIETLAGLAAATGSERVTLAPGDRTLALVALYGVASEALEPGEPRPIVFEQVAGVYPSSEAWRDLVRANVLASVKSRGIGGEEGSDAAGRRGVRGATDAATQDWLLEVLPGRYVLGRHRSAKDPGELRLADSCGLELDLPTPETGELARLQVLDVDASCVPLVLSGVTPARAAAGGVMLATLPEVSPSLQDAARPMLPE